MYFEKVCFPEGFPSMFRLLIQFRTFRIQNLFFEVISYLFGILFDPKTQEKVKAIKKRCEQATNYLSS